LSRAVCCGFHDRIGVDTRPWWSQLHSFVPSTEFAGDETELFKSRVGAERLTQT
jgi:hypothetical protein